MKIAYVNTVAGGSIGGVIQRLRSGLESLGHTSLLLYGRGPNTGRANDIRIGSVTSTFIHGLRTRLADDHGLSSHAPTMRLIKTLEAERPDVVHLHNIHGYWLHFPELFHQLTRLQKLYGLRIVWTLHDTWPLTGGCALPDAVDCRLWQTGCTGPGCPGKRIYPKALFRRTTRNLQLKKEAFTSPEQMALVAPSDFMKRRIAQSYLRQYPCHKIGTSLNADFWNVDQCAGVKRELSTVLAVAWPWYAEKGWADLLPLRQLLPPEVSMRVAGLTRAQRRRLPSSITALPKLSATELRDEYARASVLVNLSRAETFPTVCLEAQAMGCPVVAYRVGGTPETIDPMSGVLVPSGYCPPGTPNPSLPKLSQAILAIVDKSPRPDPGFIGRFLASRGSSDYLKEHLHLYC